MKQKWLSCHVHINKFHSLQHFDSQKTKHFADKRLWLHDKVAEFTGSSVWNTVVIIRPNSGESNQNTKNFLQWNLSGGSFGYIVGRSNAVSHVNLCIIIVVSYYEPNVLYIHVFFHYNCPGILYSVSWIVHHKMKSIGLSEIEQLSEIKFRLCSKFDALRVFSQNPCELIKNLYIECSGWLPFVKLSGRFFFYLVSRSLILHWIFVVIVVDPFLMPIIQLCCTHTVQTSHLHSQVYGINLD